MNEHDVIKLKTPIISNGVKIPKDTIGTIVHIYREDVFAVEINFNGDTYIETLNVNEILC